MGEDTQSVRTQLTDRRATALLVTSALIIVVVAVVMRTQMLQYYGFFEPDGYYHYAVIEAAIHNSFSVPANPPLSGWPPDCNIIIGNSTCSPPIPHGEPIGFYMITLIPYLLLSALGVSAYSVMRLMPVLFGVADVLLTYLLVVGWKRSRVFGLLAMLFVAVSVANVSKTGALDYRGDAFVTTFLLAALVVTILMVKEESKNAKLAYMTLAAILLALCNIVWNGAPFATTVYVFAVALMLTAGFVTEDGKLVNSCAYMTGALFLWFVLVSLFNTLGWIRGQVFTSSSFLVILLLLSIAVYDTSRVPDWMRRRRISFADTAQKRLTLALGVMLAMVILVYAIVPGYAESIAGLSGYNASGSLLSTVQELFRPAPQYFWNSFGLQSLMTPMGIVMIVAANLPAWLTPVMWIILFLSTLCYLFLQINSNGKERKEEEAVIRFESNAVTLILISYFALSAYLQMNAVRFGFLFSVPMAILSAFTLYWALLYARRQKTAYYASLAVSMIFVVFICYSSFSAAVSQVPTDSIDPQFIHALAWMRNNTSVNSVVLTLWADGSVVEGVANRTSVTDSVTAQSPYKSRQFAAWLYNSSPDPGFLLANYTGAPDYLLVRQVWMNESLSIFIESGLPNSSVSAYTYVQLSNLTELTNSTSREYLFAAKNFEAGLITGRTGLGNVTGAYLRLGQATLPFEYVDLYNVDTGNWSITKGAQQKATGGYVLTLLYSSGLTSEKYINVTGAYLSANSLTDTNIIKLLYQCGTYACTWDNNAASLHLVYINQDTKIFRIVYNMSKPSVAAAVAAYSRT